MDALHWAGRSPDFCEVAICEGGETRSRGGSRPTRETLELFAQSLDADDNVVLEATGHGDGDRPDPSPACRRVVVVNAQEVRAISHARVKSDRFDARRWRAARTRGCSSRCGSPSARPGRCGDGLRAARRSSASAPAPRTRCTLRSTRCLLGRALSRISSAAGGRAWLARHRPARRGGRDGVGCLRQIDFLDEEIAAIDRRLCEWALASPEARRLMTIPGVGIAGAAALMAAIGDISRFDSPRRLVAYLGLDPSVRQSGRSRPAMAGSPSAATLRPARCWSRPPGSRSVAGPLRAFWRTDPGPQGRPGRGRRRGPQDRGPGLAPTDPEEGLRLHATLARAAKIRQAELDGRAPRSARPARRPARQRPRPNAKQSSSSQSAAKPPTGDSPADWQAADLPKNGRRRDRWARILRPSKRQATRQDQAQQSTL